MIETLIRSPHAILRALYGEELELEAPPAWKFWAKRPPPMPSFPDTQAEEIDLDKAWHALHFWFSGGANEGRFPAAFLLYGGREVGSVDVGYGPARCLKSTEVSHLETFLRQYTPDKLKSWYDPLRLMDAETYPEFWDEADREEMIEYLIQNFEDLKGFVEKANTSNNGLILWLN